MNDTGLFRRIRTPILYGLLVTLMELLGRTGVLPPPAMVLDSLSLSLGSGSLGLVAICGFLENISILTVYFPGSVVILFAMASTHGNPSLAVHMWLTIFLSAQLAYSVNYWAGRILNSAVEPETRTFRTSLWISLAAFWHPHVASIFTYQQGVTGLSWPRFFAATTIAWGIWSIFWAITMYNVGAARPAGSSMVALIFACIGIWIVAEVAIFYRDKHRKDFIG